MPYFKSEKKPDGTPHPPKVPVGSKETIICMKGSSKDRVCTNSRCTFAHIFSLENITKGVGELNTWTLATDGVKWSSTKVTAAAAAAAAAVAAKAKPTVLNEDTGKDDK